MKFHGVLAAFAACVFAHSAQAHNLWLSQDYASEPKVLVIFGHPGNGAAPDKAKIIDLDLVEADGKHVSLRQGMAPGEGALTASLPAAANGAPMVAARMDGGFVIRSPQGFRATNKLMISDAVGSMWSQQYAKALLPGAEAKSYSIPAGHRLEVVPLKDPFSLKAGGKLKFRVDYEGKPTAGIEVSIGDGKTKADHPATIATDSNGIVELELFHGENIVHASLKVPGTVPALADQDSLSAALEFQLK